MPTCTKYRWKICIVEPPHRTTQEELRINSGAMRAREATIQLKQLIENWNERDRKGTMHTIFTSVSNELRQQNGSDRQWFRNITTADGLNTRAPNIDDNFHTLIHRRAETIQKLDAITNLQRSNANTGQHRVGQRLLQQDDQKPDADHSEHIVSDGREYKEARPLTSLQDTQKMITFLEKTVLFAFGVPPQALGQNINSERIAASNRLTEMVITTYTGFVTKLRNMIAEVVKKESAIVDQKPKYVGFTLCLPRYELEKVQMFLKDSYCKTLIARSYNIPEEFIDTEKMKRAIGAQAGTLQTVASPHATTPEEKKRKLVDDKDPTDNKKNKAQRPAEPKD